MEWLWIVVAVLVAVWVAGLVLKIGRGLIHLALVAAVALALILLLF
jgi:Family of unknown function (DUF5670)